ncbi:hypothetical protein A2954_01695 [Candidatus Roizmanbacteria bacterium RIFCSPLOWO2_01_FULL_37_12]|uniref:CBM-cenC domain-containing protein n=1 Tax=Candidatus Roizmanbacteria bacterium RIFCSPLOWO2_01_FULL_37_12 TaxID=1802056 RepID=A0A1F7I9C4_9BACT|nr:MAG: hypothetical protein A2768_00995 [Candidatus Roizmanbacteria bacterium RIFCSPHIGHO2_01_FULL_37_16]OGK23100.1 MAG: hypothetical protein A3D76_05840 [Candidatus Roizmanbacteria bacterium RIFCSPHIGHO2_02_FULL_37_9b]OGK39961.1 MAG: hypothetical protein A2954_01695 [Candidatus Roizmanbacteria bacterium RIFCSPLOWO2_01_FULL_37_12]
MFIFSKFKITTLALCLIIISTIFLALNKVTTTQAANIQATLVRTINTAAWSPNSPDPAGLEYRASTNTLLVTDSEVEEMPNYYQGKNMFESQLSGSLVNTYNTTHFSNEPAGLALNSANGNIYSSHDGQKKVYVIKLGQDGLWGTPDDVITSLSTSAFGSNDPEGLAYGSGKLFIADGVGTEVYTVDPGPNGQFDGIAPTGDDTVTHFDTAVYGQADPEGIAFNSTNNSLYVVSNNGGKIANKISEFSLNGNLLNEIDISFLGARSTAGLAFAPGSNNPAINNIYIAARGVDNNSDPNENDGKIYEITLSGAAPTATNTPTPSQQGNLLINSGFELDANSDSKPDNWTLKNFFTRSNTLVHGGSFSGRHSSTTDNGYTILQKVTGITAGSTYSFSGWTNIPATTDSFTYKLQVRWLNSTGGIISTKTAKTYTAATSGWNQASTNLVAPAGATTADIRMIVSSLNAQIYSDDLTFGKL